MAVTRIKNNQITDASGSNTQLGVNAAVKLQNYSVTAGKLANSLVYGSDLTISGNLTVNGQTTTVDTVNTLIKDPILTLADGQTAGTPTVDIGLLGLRGNQNSSFLGWQESGTTFMAILSNTTASNTTVNVTSYANFTASTITAQGNLSVVGNIVGTANFTGNVSAGNLLTPGLVSATGNSTAGNFLTGGLISATGNATSGNVLTGGLVSATGDITGGNLATGGTVSATGTATLGNVATGGTVSATGNITGGNVNFGSGVVSGTGNIYANTIFANISGNIDAAGSNTQIQFNGPGDLLSANANFTYDYATNLMTVNGGGIATGNLSATANVTGGNVLTGGLISATGTATAGNVLTGGLVSATGNITTANALNGATLSLSGNVSSALNVTGNIAGANITTPGLISATGNATAGNINTAGLVSATGNVIGGNVTTVGLISATGNATAGNIATAGLISATGNITSATNVNTPNVRATGNLEFFGGNILITPSSGNIIVNNTYINGIAQPVQDNDAASKIYVDNRVSTQIAYHQAVTAATTANLATTTGGTITYSQPNGAANGVGALITTTGSFNLIDTANVQTANTRILVKNEGNAVLNGVYVWTNATAIVRSTDTDEYGPNSAEQLSVNDYFFVTSGNVNAGSAWIVDSPAGTITFGTSNIAFAQFSSSQTYTSGNGININGTVINTLYDNSTIGINGSNQLYIPANAPLTTPNIGAATGTSLSVTGAITAGTNLSAVANVVAGNVTTTGLISAAGNATAGNINTAGLVSATGNVVAGNVTTVGLVSATGNVNGGNVISSALVQGVTVSASGNVIGGNVTTVGLVSATGNVNGGNVISSALVQGVTVSASGNVIGGNVSTVGLITATGNITGGNFLTSGLVSATGNVNGGNVISSALVEGVTVSASGNVIGGNVTTAGLISATGNATSGNVLTGGIVSATGNAIAGNINTAGLVSATGNIYGGNLILSGAALDTSAGRLTVNSTSADADFAVNGDTLANVFYVDAGTGTASFGTSAQTTNAIVAFNTNTSILLPTGNTSARPGTGVTGMIRFNTTNNGLEIYDNSEWTPVGTTTFTLIADEQFNGDGSTVAFTLASSQTTNSCIVSINGVVQIPTSAYSVSTTTLTFTEAPAAGDLIDVRELTTTTTVTSISNNSGNATVTGSPTAAQIDILGNLVPSGNAVYDLGTASNYWKSLYVGGNTIYLGGLQLKSATGNVFSVTTDGSTPANISIGGASAVSTTGNVTGGNINGIINTNSILNSGANGTGNIGSASTYFNTVFAKATSAQYADLAEKYEADAEYAPGTVVSFGGDKEVTVSAKDADRAVAGVVSTNPSYIMNATLEAEHVAVVAFTGRVPTSVTGTVAKGDLMVSNGDGTARAEADPKAGSIIGKSLENFDGAAGVIEVVIGRF